MKIEIHAVPFGDEGHRFLQIKSRVRIVYPVGPGVIRRVETEALWDTGATNTCIPMRLAVAMGMKLGDVVPVDKMRTQEPSRYCQFHLEFPTGETIFMPEAVAVPNMQARFIIGMDFIRKGVTTIEPDGQGGVNFTFVVLS